MKILFMSLLFIGIGMVTFLSSCKEDECETVISGIVIDSLTHQPVKDVYIYFTGRSKGFGGRSTFGSVSTSASGGFQTIFVSEESEDLMMSVSYDLLCDLGYSPEPNIVIKACFSNDELIIKLNKR